MGMFLKLERVSGGDVWVNPLSIDAFRDDPYQDEETFLSKAAGTVIHMRSGLDVQVKGNPEKINEMIETWVSEAVYDLPGDEEEPYTGAMPEDQG